MKKWIAFVLVLVVLFSFAGCGNNNPLSEIALKKVASIELWCNDPFTKVELNAEEIETFVKLYNASQYQGEGTGVGGTPVFGATVYYEDGSAFCINEFNGTADLEVTFHSSTKQGAWCYVNNPELLTYMEEKLN